MNIQELEDRIVSVSPHGYGTYKVTIKYRNQNYSCLSHNSMAYDAYRGSDTGYYTYKQALQALYNECKQHNDI